MNRQDSVDEHRDVSATDGKISTDESRRSCKKMNGPKEFQWTIRENGGSEHPTLPR